MTSTTQSSSALLPSRSPEAQPEPAIAAQTLKPLTPDAPWRGPQSYEEADHSYFRGRLPQVEELQYVIESQRLTVLYGLSGLGKTSLLRAGVFPKLRVRDQLPVYIRLIYSTDCLSLHMQVLEALRDAAQSANVEIPRLNSDTLWEHFHRIDADFWSANNHLVTPVLVFDQFEELFSRGAHSREAQCFIDELADLIEGRVPKNVGQRIEANPKLTNEFDLCHHRYRVVLSLREDFLPHLMDLRQKMPSLVRNHMRLLPLNGEAALDVVEVGTADIIPRKVAEAVIRVVAGNEIDSSAPPNELVIEPAILSLFCTELNQRRPEGKPVSSELVRDCGGSILEDYYERCMRSVEPKTRYFVEDQLLTNDGFRQDRSYADAVSSGIREKDLSVLIDERLLRVEERARARRLELTHDVLARVAAASKQRRQEREQAEVRERALQKEAELAKQERELAAAEFARQERERTLERELERARQERELAAAELARRERERTLERLLEQTRQARRRFVTIALIAVASVLGVAGWILYYANTQQASAAQQKHHADEVSREIALTERALEATKAAKAEAEEAKRQADHQRDATRRYLDSLKSFFSTVATLETLVANQGNTPYRFLADAKLLPAAITGGEKQYSFHIWLDPESMAKDERIAVVMIRLDHPSFESRFLTATPREKDGAFTAQYYGYGCVKKGFALIEYEDPDKPSRVARVNMCEAIWDKTVARK